MGRRWRYGYLWTAMVAMAAACSSTAPERSEFGATKQDPNRDGSSENGSNGNGSPNGSSQPSGGFRVSGRLPGLPAPQAGNVRVLDAPTPTHVGDAGSASARRATHVIAVTPSSQNTRRVVAEVAPTGAFTLDLDPARVWVMVFVDSTRVGPDMVLGVFRARGLDTLAPMRRGEADLGEVSTSASRAAEGSIAYEALLAALGVDEASALVLGAVDDVCLRVVNPDIDGNGVIDALEPSGTTPRDYRLDFHVHFGMQTDRRVHVGDLVGAFLPDSVAVSYENTGVHASFPSRLFADGWQSSVWSSFSEAMHYSPGGGGGPSGVVSLPANERMPASALGVAGYGDYADVYFMAPRGYDLPQDYYRFGVGSSTLTFTGVQTRTNAEFEAAENMLMPFIRFVASDANCTSNCQVSGVDYVWKKRGAAGWVDATVNEVALMAGEQGGHLSFRLGNVQDRQIDFTIPPSPVSGRIAWSSAHVPNDATRAAFATATVSDICHVGLSYDDKLGMRYFGAIDNAPDTCP